MKPKIYTAFILIIILVSGFISCSGKSDSGRHIRVVILGFDGASWATIDPLLKEGKLPFLKQLKEESAWANFRTFKPTKSNVVWTTIASGKSMLKHGILDFVYLKEKGIQVPFSKSNRLAPMLWQILDLYKKRGIVLNWWVSHPPDKINGIMVSDHFRKITTTRPEFVNEYRDSVHPKSYFDRLKKLAEENKKYIQVLKRTGLPEYISLYYQAHPKGDHLKIPVLGLFPRLLKYDATIESVSDYLYKNEPFNFFATYFRFPDIIQHFVIDLMPGNIKEQLKDLDFKSPKSREYVRETTEKISHLLEPAYTYMERILKSYLSRPGQEDTYFFIMSDHGFSLTPRGYDHYDIPENFEAPDGFLIIKGPSVRKGEIKNVSIYDIAPTILSLYNLPVGKEMDGRVLLEVFNLSRKIRTRRYTLKKESPVDDRHYNREAMEELRSMGYID